MTDDDMYDLMHGKMDPSSVRILSNAYRLIYSIKPLIFLQLPCVVQFFVFKFDFDEISKILPLWILGNILHVYKISKYSC